MKFLKRIIPVPIKYILWYVLKSPQRKLGFWNSISLEISALFVWITHILFLSNKTKLRPISICTGIKDRTSQYLDYMLPSILKMAHQDLVEISIYDVGSEDVTFLEQRIKELWKGKLVFNSDPQPFTRSVSFNSAIEQSSNELFFACDADMSLPEDLVYLCNRFVTSKTAWFPIVFDLFENKPSVFSRKNGKWRQVGKGMFASTKQHFLEAGKYNTIYTQWGWEDIDLWISYFKAGIVPLRTKCKGLMHHWHPSLEVKIEVPEHLKEFNL
jgi:glycosyltransferase involved in cell wall biosynthesis